MSGMLKRWFGILMGALLSLQAAEGVRFAILRTGSVSTLERFAFAGGRWSSTVPLDHAAFLVQHPKGTLLFDTGLGEAIDRQYRADMPLLMRPLFPYRRTLSARAHLDQQGTPLPERILLSHLHWDHASGLADFPGVPVWAHAPEQALLQSVSRATTFPSQVLAPGIPWHWFHLAPTPFGPFHASLDLFGDGTVVVVPLPGHTPGSVGLALRTATGGRFLLVGDAVWKAEAIQGGAPRFWATACIVDHDRAGARETVRFLQRLQAQDPGLTFIPAHDASLHERLGLFPRWIH